jgi:hypothetical protein
MVPVLKFKLASGKYCIFSMGLSASWGEKDRKSLENKEDRR